MYHMHFLLLHIHIFVLYQRCNCLTALSQKHPGMITIRAESANFLEADLPPSRFLSAGLYAVYKHIRIIVIFRYNVHVGNERFTPVLSEI